MLPKTTKQYRPLDQTPVRPPPLRAEAIDLLKVDGMTFRTVLGDESLTIDGRRQNCRNGRSGHKRGGKILSSAIGEKSFYTWLQASIWSGYEHENIIFFLTLEDTHFDDIIILCNLRTYILYTC